MVKIIQNFLDNNPGTRDAIRLITNIRTYNKQYNFLKKSIDWDREKIEEYQINELKKIIKHAYQNVPYYTKLFKNLGLEPNDFQSFKDLIKLPFITKKIIRRNLEDFKAKNYPKFKIQQISTGGSTGEPLHIYCERGAADARYIAYLQTIFKQSNCSYSNRHIYITGVNKIYKSQFFGRIMLISSFFINDKNLPLIIQKIRKFKPRFIVSYPSAIIKITRFINKKNLAPFSNIKSIVCAGEILYNNQRELLKKTYNCEVYGFYNHAELTVFAGTCNFNYIYHIYPEYGFCELIDKNNKTVSSDGGKGEIIGTGFFNYVFPLIRYRTNDIGILTNKKCECGRNYLSLKSIEGRLQYYVISKTNKQISLMGISSIIVKSSNNIDDCQFLQETEGELILSIVKDKNFSKSDEVNLINNLTKKFGKEINLKIRYVENIDRSVSGKTKFLIQKLPVEY